MFNRNINRSLVLLFMLILVQLCGCGGGGSQVHPPEDPNLPVTGYPDPEIQPRRGWNFLVYICAEDSRPEFSQMAFETFNNLETVGSNANANILVLYDRESNDSWSQTRLYYVTKDNRSNTINSQILGVLDEMNMGDPATLRDFLIWCKRYYPADHTMLTLWDHGSGVNPKSNPKISGRAGLQKGICFDTYDYLANDEVGQALAEARAAGDSHNKVDVLFAHGCNMQLLEAIYDWRNEADFVVGSENPIYLTSLDYFTRYASHTANSSSITPRQLATAIVNDYIEATPNGGDWHAELSAVETGAKFETLIDRFKVFATALRNTSDRSNVNKAWTELDLMIFTSQVDLDKFAVKIGAYSRDAALATAASNLHAAISDVVVHHREKGYLAGRLSGIAILLTSETPWNDTYSYGYKTVQLSIDTDWDEFIEIFIDYATDRPMNQV